MVTARSAAMAFNRLADRRLDAENPRTAGRHLPAGLLSTGSVALFTAAAAVGFVAVDVVVFAESLAALSFAAGAGVFVRL